MAARPLTPEQQQVLATVLAGRGSGRSMNFPGVRQSYLDDPKTKLAETMLGEGSSTAPVAGGGWGFVEGLARLGQGAMGGKWAGEQKRSYEAEAERNANRFAELYKAMGGQTPEAPAATQDRMSVFNQPEQPGQGQPNLMPVAQAMSGQPSAMTAGAPKLPGQPPNFPQPSAVSRGPTPYRAASQATSVGQGSSGGRANRLNRITMMAESAGNPNAVSPVGARGLMQVMPDTARDPGFGIRPSNGTKEDDVRLGEEYRAAMEREFGGDLKAMWAAYNAGPTRVKNAIKTHGAAWLEHMPRETREYVAKNMAAAGEAGGGAVGGGGGTVGSTGGYPELPPEPEMPGEPDIPESKPSQRRLLAEALMAGGDAMFPLMQQNLAAGMEEEADLNKQREENIAQLKSLTHQSRMQAWQGQINDRYKAIIDERKAGIEHGYDMDLQRLQNEGQLANTMANNEARGSSLRPLGVNSANKLTSLNNQLQSLLSLSDTFSDDFFGKGAGWLGDLQNKAYETLGIGDQKQVDWWKAYNMMDSIVKKELYGANFTQNEKKDWDKAVITTATSPQAARMNIERRLQIVHDALMRQANSDAHVYNNEQIDDLINIPATSKRMSERTKLYTPPAAAPQGQAKPTGQQGQQGAGFKPKNLPYGATDMLTDGDKTYYLVNGEWMEETGGRKNRPAGTPRK